MSSCPVDPEQVAAATLRFLDCGESATQPTQEFCEAFANLVDTLNPERLLYADDQRVGSVLAWAARVKGELIPSSLVSVEGFRKAREATEEEWGKRASEFGAAVEAAEKESVRRSLVTPIAIGVNTLVEFWRLHEVPDPAMWPKAMASRMSARLPERIFSQMRAAAEALKSGEPVEWYTPPRATAPVTVQTAEAAYRAADHAVRAVAHLVEYLTEHHEVDPGSDWILLGDFERMRCAADEIPSEGWGSQVQEFREFKASGRCGHVAVKTLAYHLQNHFANAAWEAAKTRWGVAPHCQPIPLIWTPEARPGLWDGIKSRGEFDLAYWLDRLQNEAERLKAAPPAQDLWFGSLQIQEWAIVWKCDTDIAAGKLKSGDIRAERMGKTNKSPWRVLGSALTETEKAAVLKILETKGQAATKAIETQDARRRDRRKKKSSSEPKKAG